MKRHNSFQAATDQSSRFNTLSCLQIVEHSRYSCEVGYESRVILYQPHEPAREAVAVDKRIEFDISDRLRLEGIRPYSVDSDQEAQPRDLLVPQEDLLHLDREPSLDETVEDHRQVPNMICERARRSRGHVVDIVDSHACG